MDDEHDAIIVHQIDDLRYPRTRSCVAPFGGLASTAAAYRVLTHPATLFRPFQGLDGVALRMATSSAVVLAYAEVGVLP